LNPVLRIDLTKLEDNARAILKLCRDRGIEPWAVTKVVMGDPAVAARFIRAGFSVLAESRLENCRRIKTVFPSVKMACLRIPMISQADEIVSYFDISLNSEPDTLRALSAAAARQNKRHQVVLMVDLGDLREGLWPGDVKGVAELAQKLPGLELLGLGTNLTCYGGVIPDANNVSQLVGLARQLGVGFVSGGNSSSIPLLFNGEMPGGVTNLRLGESLVLGRETAYRTLIPGLHGDAFTLEAEVVEVKTKPSVPIGTIGQDAFGGVPHYVDRGLMRRAICAVGRQDIAPDGVTPRETGIEVLGASSDHLLLDVTRAECEVKVGDKLTFELGYGALLQAVTSPFVTKVYEG
jgi:predicted amino acid racemase